MSHRHAVFPGSFDPFTLGHLDLVERATALFETVTVAVAQHPSKSALLPLNDRMGLIESCTAGLEGVRVAPFEGLVVDGCRQLGASVLLRGLRGAADLEYERPMALSNRLLAPGIETVFLLPSSATAHISATLVRQIARMGGDLSSFVPQPVLQALNSPSQNPTSHE